MSNPLFRIISDVHFGDASSLVRKPEAMRPLFDGVQAVIFNGDTLETRTGPRAVEQRGARERFLAFCQDHATPKHFITGNHDPDLSPHHHFDLAGGEVLVTHGDVLFKSIVPWDRNVRKLELLYAMHLERMPAERRHEFTTRLTACRAAAYDLPSTHDLDRKGLLGLIIKTWPPWRILHMVKAWNNLPTLAALFTRKHRPSARFVMVGHTHFPGVWDRHGVTVINTGSFIPLLGRQLVEIEPDAIVLRQIVHQRGEFRPGAVRDRFPLNSPARLTDVLASRDAMPSSS